MTVEYFTVGLGQSGVKGNQIGAIGEHNQVVTFTDVGAITGAISVKKFGYQEIGSETGDPDGGDDLFILDLALFNDDFTVATQHLDSGDVFQISGFLTHAISGTLHTYTYTGTDGLIHTFSFESQSYGGGIVTVTCFVKGTLIETETGPMPIEELARHMLVLCGDKKLRPIEWIGTTKLSAKTLQEQAHLRPIRIGKDAFGVNKPARDLLVSPQHRILLQGIDIDLLFGSSEALVAAKHLINGSSVTVENAEAAVEYFHILFDKHQTVFSEGLETESFFPGTSGLDVLEQAVQDELFEIFPELRNGTHEFGPTCKPALKAIEVAALNNFRQQQATVASHV